MKQTIVIVLIVITLSLTMTGCVAPDGTWKFDGTVKHEGDEVVPSPTPEVVYVTQTPEVVYVTVTPTPIPTLIPEPTTGFIQYPPGLEEGGCEGLDQNVLRRYDHDKNGLIDSKELGNAKLGYTNNYETQYDYLQIVYAYKHQCPVWSPVSPTPAPTPEGEARLWVARGYPGSAAQGEIFEVTIRIRNDGSQVATEIMLDEPTIPGTYKNRCPSTIDDIEPGEETTLSYYIEVVDTVPGSYNLGPTVLNYKCSRIGSSCSSESLGNFVDIITQTPTVQPTPEPTAVATPTPTFDNPVIVIDPPIYSGVVRNNGEILDIRITPDPLVAGDDATVEVDVLNTGTVESCYELHWHAAPSGVYEEEAWIYAGDMETFTYTSRMRDPGERTWTFKLYWDAKFPASNVLLQTATVDVHCYTQYEVDNM